MFSLTDISVDFLTGSPAVVGLALLALLVLSFLLYRHTNPPLPVYLRILLGALRVIAVLALLAALSEPVISYTQEFERTRRVSLLIDRSASMDSEEDGRSRTARVDSDRKSVV